MNIPDQDICRLLAERHLSKLRNNEWAIRCLEQGYDSPSLRMLAAMSPSEYPSIVEDKLNNALNELGWAMIHPEVFLLQYARTVAEEILAAKVDSIAGSREMYGLLRATDSHSELSAWYDIDEMIWSLDNYEKARVKDEYYYTEPDELDRVIKQACADFLQRTRRKFALLPETSFDEAEATFKDFLGDNQHSANVKWLFAEDAIITSRSVLIRTPLSEMNREWANELYDRGKEQNNGLAMHAFAEMNGDTYAYIILPQDDLDARYHLMGPDYVKFTCRLNLLNSKASTDRLSWFIRNLFVDDAKRIGNEDRMPFRRS